MGDKLLFIRALSLCVRSFVSFRQNRARPASSRAPAVHVDIALDVRVPFWTVRFAGIYDANTDAAREINLRCHGLQVCRVTAPRYAAQMIQHLIAWYRTIRHFVHEPVDVNVFPFEARNTVALSIIRALPYPTRFRLEYAGVKALLDVENRRFARGVQRIAMPSLSIVMKMAKSKTKYFSSAVSNPARIERLFRSTHFVASLN